MRTIAGCTLLAILLMLTISVEAPAEGPPREVAFTIDDLPFAAAMPARNELTQVRAATAKILASLEAHRVPAIGFVNEQKVLVPSEVDDRIALLEAWSAAGMELGNHTFSHPNLKNTPLDRYQENVLKGEVLTRWLLERRGAELRYFRFPFNSTGPTAEVKAAFQEFLGEHGYRVAPFTVEHADYAFDRVYAHALARGDRELADRTRTAYLEQLDTAFDYGESLAEEMFGRPIRHIFLIHSNEINADSLDTMLERLTERGYRFISLDRALEDKAFQVSDDYVGPWGISWLHRWRLALDLPRRTDEPDPPQFVLDEYRKLSSGG
jgi:peptidoglycan/xylan/chitin deacetylase (PgdA/CDA1 family)